jgi:RNA polymerase sigma-70 factor (ECF subfamily)
MPGRLEPERDSDALVAALASGDEIVFSELVARWSSAMLKLALVHVHSRAIAEEVVQDAWLTMLGSLDRFEGRSTLRTWVLGIVVNLARARARRERRSVPMSIAQDQPLFETDRFLGADHPRWPNHWAVNPAPWPTPEEHLLAQETRAIILGAVEALPPAQREVLILRDLEGLPASDACNILGLTDTNQRVLLHRARTRVRHALERYFAATEAR